MNHDEYLEHRADFHIIPGDTSDRFEKYWLTCTFCGRQSPPINNGGGECPYCNSETVYIEDEFAYADLLSKIEREES